MFLHRLAAGLVFASGAALSRLGITDGNWALVGFGFTACVGGMAWLASGSSPDREPIVLRA
jgi:hypothetical protein